MTASRELQDKIEAAFGYRGDVTVDHVGGATTEGFLSNRDHDKRILDLFLESGEMVRLSYSDVTDIRLTGKDHFVPFEKSES